MSEWLCQSEEFSSIVPQILGQVFDSAPGRRTASSFLRATSASSLGGPGLLNQGGWLGGAVRALMPYAFLALAYLFAAWRALLGKALGWNERLYLVHPAHLIPNLKGYLRNRG